MGEKEDIRALNSQNTLARNTLEKVNTPVKESWRKPTLAGQRPKQYWLCVRYTSRLHPGANFSFNYIKRKQQM